MGGSSLDGNPRLRLAVDKAYDNNMTKETVERAIKRGAGEVDDANVARVRRDDTLQDPRTVFQILKRHFSRYTPEMVRISAWCRP